MASNNQLNPTIIGAFVISAVSLLIVGILIFSSGKWFVDKQRYVIYFDESVNGLNIGAPVKLSGVPIGKVIAIKVRFYAKTNEVLTPVYIEIEPDKTIGISGQEQSMDAEQKLELLIKKGLRMQLQLNSLLTGQLYIEALVRPDTPVKLIQDDNEVQELPSIKSSGAELQNVVSEAFDEFQKIPFEPLFEDISKLVKNLEQISSSEQIMSTIKNLNSALVNANKLLQNLEQITGSKTVSNALDNFNQTLVSTNKLVQNIDQQTGPLISEVKRAVVTINSTMEQMQATLKVIETTVGPDASIVQNLETTLDEINQAARSGRLLMDYLERHPEALLQGKQP